MRHLDLYLEMRSHHAMLRQNVQEHQELSICPYSKETYNYNLNLNLKYSTKRLELEGVVRYQRNGSFKALLGLSPDLLEGIR